jgi:TolA-binding protein
MSAHDHRPNPEDLSALSRRGMLSEADERLLVRALADDPTVGAAHTVGLDLDRSTAVRAGDEALVARIADRALARVAASGLSPKPASRKRPRQLAALLAAALFLASGVAAGVWFGVVPARFFSSAERHPRSIPAEPNAPATKTLVSDRPAEPPADPDKEGAEAGSDLTAIPALENGADSAPRARPNRGAAESTAAELFRAGNAARHAADFPRAKRLYSELIQKYPTSEEASVARVSLGKLLLAKGDTTAAEHEFRQYLKNGRGQLAEEAFVSRAHSLQKLGRTDAERATWQELLANYPETVYAAEAEARLRVLSRGE